MSEHKFSILISLPKKQGKTALASQIVEAHQLAEQLLNEARETHQQIANRFNKVNTEFKKTLPKQITKYGFLQAKHSHLGALLLKSAERVARREKLLESILNIFHKSVQKVLSSEKVLSTETIGEIVKESISETSLPVYCSACQSTKKGEHRANCSLMTASKRGSRK